MSRKYGVLTLALTMVMGQFVSDAWAEKSMKGRVVYTQQVRVANELLQTGKYPEAEAMYTKALQEKPNDVAARGGLAMAQAELYKLDAAEKNANMVLTRDPNNAAAHLALGMVYRNRTASHDMFYKGNRDGLLSDSVSSLQQAIDLDSRNPEAYNELGVTYRFQGRYADAQRMFEKAIAIDPDYAEALLNHGIVLLQNGDIAGAKQKYSRAIQRNSKNYMAHFRLGEALGQEGNYHEALKSLNTGLALNRGNASIMNKMAELYDKQGNQAAAVANYRKAIQANPGFMPSYVGLSRIFDERGDGEAAMVELRSALNANPEYAPARNQLGRLALSVDKPDQAVNYYRESLKRNSVDVDAINGLSQALTVLTQKNIISAQALGQDSDLVDAEQTIDEALKLAPNDLRLHLARIRVGQLTGRPKASPLELVRLVNQPARTESDEILRGEAYLALGRYAESDQVFDQLIRKNSAQADKLLLLGDTLRINGDLDKAEEAYKAGLLAEPGNVKATRGLQRIEVARAEANKTLRLAKSLNNFIQKGSAVDFYEETLSKNPKQPDARLALAKLYEKQDNYGKAADSYRYYLALVPQLPEKKRAKYEKKISKLQERILKTSSN